MSRPPHAIALDAAGASHVGRVRTLNEDRFVSRPDSGVFAVADGMGGHDSGEVAASMIARLLDAIAPAADAAQLLATLEERVIRANDQIVAYARLNGKGTVGSTLAALLLHSGFFAVVWCGDSRVYLMRGGELIQLSRDHTEAREMVESGLLTEAEAATWPRRNVLTRAIGAGESPELEMEHGPVAPGDAFLLCSDGLTGHVSDAEIRGVLKTFAPRDACKALIGLALERGGTDNVTVVVVACRDGGPIRPSMPGPRPPTDVWE